MRGAKLTSSPVYKTSDGVGGFGRLKKAGVDAQFLRDGVSPEQRQHVLVGFRPWERPVHGVSPLPRAVLPWGPRHPAAPSALGGGGELRGGGEGSREAAR